MGGVMGNRALCFGNTDEFIANEFERLELRDKRLANRAKKIFSALQMNLTSCIRRLCLNAHDTPPSVPFFLVTRRFLPKLCYPRILKTR